MAPKRILFLENGVGYGGAPVCMKLLAANLNRDKYYPIMVTSLNNHNYQSMSDVAEWTHIPDTFVDKNIIKKMISPFFLKFRIKERYLEVIISTVDYLVNVIPYTFRLLLFTMRKKVDLIHLNNEPVCNMAGVFVAKLLKIPCIGHVRGPTWDSKISRWLYKMVDFFITVSDWTKGEVLKINVREDKVMTIWDGRNLEKFDMLVDESVIRETLMLKPGQLSVGMIGLLNPWKGHKVFIQAAQKVVAQFPDCKFFIVGAPAEILTYDAELKSMVCEMKLEKNIIFAGHRNDAIQVMNAMDVIVHASIEPDPYPNVVIEAMAVGKPVIATNIGGPPEMIENYKTGILIPPGEPSVLSEKICELLGSRDLRLSMGEEAKKIAFKRNSIEAHVRQVENVYERFINK